ncbi:NAD(P)-binding protein [Solirubrobacter ginsenosidimutans]|uniref:NAD(P)-binding protein n=1 Tax=Solirubrobacter ginsenosidimutans TaxID=490573 RepID=A0A9X3RZ73_9ACTN|nr:NAD(P)-binding protein [Solirubrobacter ginsenosidimutans]MDA0159854.1 NAD(P)-binding protein [Solirubrobacter ginsenosidimutans]
MRIAIVGAGLTGLSAAHHLGEDPRHATSVFETRARVGGVVDCLFRLGVTLRRSAQVERLAVDESGTDLWINGLAERFDLALVATSPAQARALLVRSGIGRRLGSMALGKRVYFAEHGAADPGEAARAAIARIAADHPTVRTRPVPAPPRGEGAWRSLARRAGGLTGAHVHYVDLSGHAWPLGAPAVYIANQRWILDLVPHQLMIRGLRTLEVSDATNAVTGQLEAGGSVAFVVEGATATPHGCGAALAALAVNAPIVPLAAKGRPERRRRESVRVVIGEPFFPETSSIDELMDDMRMVVRYLERLATST